MRTAPNIRRIAEVAKLFLQNGAVVIRCFVSPTIAIREQARSIIGANDFLGCSWIPHWKSASGVM